MVRRYSDDELYNMINRVFTVLKKTRLEADLNDTVSISIDEYLFDELFYYDRHNSLGVFWVDLNHYEIVRMFGFRVNPQNWYNKLEKDKIEIIIKISPEGEY